MKYFAGVDLGGTNTAVGIIDEYGKLLSLVSRPTAGSFEGIVNEMALLIREATEKAGIDYDAVCGVGVGVPGAIDKDGLGVIMATNLQWYNVPFGQALEKATGKRVSLGNDADCALLAEVTCGAAEGKDSAVMITLGTGVGGAIVMNGKPFAGCTIGGTEPGHLTLVHGGEQCSCGQRGCVEMYASATALIRQTKAMMQAHPESAMWQVCPNIDDVNGKTAFDGAKMGDVWAKSVIDTYIDYVAAAAAGLVNIFRPEIVVVGGGISNQGDYFVKPLNDAVAAKCFAAKFIAAPQVVTAKLGNDAGIIGAGMLCK